MSHRANQPSPQRIHDSFLLVPGVVTTELLDLRQFSSLITADVHCTLCTEHNRVGVDGADSYIRNIKLAREKSFPEIENQGQLTI